MSEELVTLQQQMMEMQSQLAFQEDTVRGLDEALGLQQQEILLLRRQLELLKERQDTLATSSDGSPPGTPTNEKPPHY